MPLVEASLTRTKPGSESSGVPASLATAIVFPSSRSARRRGRRWRSLCSWREISGFLIPRCASSRPVCRVSSQATRSASSNAALARGERSSRLPIGVATTTSLPAMSVPRDLLVQVHRAAREARDQHQPPLEAEALLVEQDSLHHPLVIAPRHHLFRPQALIEEEIKDLVRRQVVEAQVSLVRLTREEIRGRRLVDDRGGQPEVARELPDLRLVQIAQGVQRARVVPED